MNEKLDTFLLSIFRLDIFVTDVQCIRSIEKIEIEIHTKVQ